jgi:hypothetical protein
LPALTLQISRSDNLIVDTRTSIADGTRAWRRGPCSRSSRVNFCFSFSFSLLSARIYFKNMALTEEGQEARSSSWRRTTAWFICAVAIVAVVCSVLGDGSSEANARSGLALAAWSSGPAPPARVYREKVGFFPTGWQVVGEQHSRLLGSDDHMLQDVILVKVHAQCAHAPHCTHGNAPRSSRCTTGPTQLSLHHRTRDSQVLGAN